MQNEIKYKPAKIIAEVGCNHKGDIEIAKELISTAAVFCKADVVKFQKRTPKELLSEQDYNAPHPNPANSYGETYGEHREFLEFSIEQHKVLKNWCEKFKIEYSCSVWDITSAKEISSLNPKLIKIPSAINLNKPVLEYLCENYGGEIHVSLGMTTRDEQKDILNYFENKKRNNDLVIYACTSGYPVPFDEVGLQEISRLKKEYQNKVKSIGFSGHHLGIAVDASAYTLGAEWIERHYTLDRTWKGTDHAASLEPDGVRRIVRDLKAIYKALQVKNVDIYEIEYAQREKLKKNQIKWTN